MSEKDGLIRAEDRAWAEFRGLTEGLTREQLTRVGYEAEWSVKDLVAHMACWDAEAARALEQIRLGTYTGWDRDEVVVSKEYYEACRDLDADTVWVQLHAGRARMLEELERIPEDLLEPGSEAWRWFHDSGVTHHDEHLPRLRVWVAELRDH